MTFLFGTGCFAQDNSRFDDKQVGYGSKFKPVLDTNALNRWPSVSAGSISNDGHFVSYVVKYMSTYAFEPYVSEVYTVLQNRDGKVKHIIKGVNNLKFTKNSKQAVFIKPGDTLCIMDIESYQYTIKPNVSSFQLLAFDRNEWLVYQQKTDKKILHIINTKTKAQLRYEQVSSYMFSPNGQNIVIEIESERGGEFRLQLVDLVKNHKSIFWASNVDKVQQILFSIDGRSIAFTTDDGQKKSIWHYEKYDSGAIRLITDQQLRAESRLRIGTLRRFSNRGNKVLLMLDQKDESVRPKKINSSKVSIWSYTELKLQTEQVAELKNRRSGTKSFFSVLDVPNRKIVRLQFENEIMNGRSTANNNDDYCLIMRLDTTKYIGGRPLNENWLYSTLYLVSISDGHRVSLPWKGDINGNTTFRISPNGKYVIYANDSAAHYFSYEIATGIIRNITQLIPANLTQDHGYRIKQKKYLINLGGWLKGDEGVLVYDRNDIWLIDPKGFVKPVNVTNHYGKKNGIIFRLATLENNLAIGDKILLAAFNERTKQSGYFFMVLGQKKDPVKLLMDSSLIIKLGGYHDNESNLVKAANANAWLIMKESANESPNYFFSTDLKSWERISNIHPEKNYNWLKTELHSWIAPDGDTLQGIMYKPENFDSTKNYPVIFNYYRQVSDRLYEYKHPEGVSSQINIPWFVSRGYIVFTPDIHHSVPDLRGSVINSVVSAAQYVSRLPYVNAERMAINGHSFGGLETGLLVTSSSMFAAAIASGGYYNLTSDIGTILPRSGSNRDGTSETHMGGTLWENQNYFTKNSPLFSLEQVSSPVLIMTGEQDGQVPHSQSIEFFLGLRRLGKRAWMLSYEEGGHTLQSKADVIDYTNRVVQFYDHYLKYAPAPMWMTQGIPARLKGVITGYDLDLSGNCGNDCKVCKNWNEKWATDSVATKQLIEKEEKNQWMGLLEKIKK